MVHWSIIGGMFSGLMGGRPKNYEMPPEANWTTQDLRQACQIEGLESHIKWVDVKVRYSKAGSEPVEYVLHHIGKYYGWELEFVHAKGQDISGVVNALRGIMGGRTFDVALPEEHIKTCVSPSSKVTLSELAGFIDAYPTKGLVDPKIVGLRIENLSSNLYKTATDAGLPLQEVKETKP